MNSGAEAEYRENVWEDDEGCKWGGDSDAACNTSVDIVGCGNWRGKVDEGACEIVCWGKVDDDSIGGNIIIGYMKLHVVDGAIDVDDGVAGADKAFA